MMKRISVTIIVLCLLLSHFAGVARAGDLPKWPLRNGDFSTSRNWGMPASWQPRTESGRHNFGLEPETPLWRQPSLAIIHTLESGVGSWNQKIQLMKGEYRLSVEAYRKPTPGTDGGPTRIGFESGGKKMFSDWCPTSGAWTNGHLCAT